MTISYALTGEGSSDRLLFPIIEWTLKQHLAIPFRGMWADPAVFDDRSKDVETRISQTIRYYPSDLLFVHRDADGAGIDARMEEIRNCDIPAGSPTVVCVVPVRMTEAWFLFDERAIRLAADHPNGRGELNLPNQREAQRIATPKERLSAALVAASAATGRRRQEFKARLPEKKYLVAQNIQDFSPLRLHTSFQRFEGMLVNLAAENGWVWDY